MGIFHLRLLDSLGGLVLIIDKIWWAQEGHSSKECVSTWCNMCMCALELQWNVSIIFAYMHEAFHP